MRYAKVLFTAGFTDAHSSDDRSGLSAIRVKAAWGIFIRGSYFKTSIHKNISNTKTFSRFLRIKFILHCVFNEC